MLVYGYNDTWNIEGIQSRPLADIYIFDRYGKLLKQLNPAGPGWDGTYNGKLMPATDYWFSITLDIGLFTLSDADNYVLSLIVANPNNEIDDPSDLTVAYYLNENDALLELNQLPNNYT